MKIGAQINVARDFAAEMAKRVQTAHAEGKIERADANSGALATSQDIPSDSVVRQRLEELVRDVIHSGAGEDLLHQAVRAVVTADLLPLVNEPAVLDRICDAMVSDPNVQGEMDWILQELAVGLARQG